MALALKRSALPALALWAGAAAFALLRPVPPRAPLPPPFPAAALATGAVAAAVLCLGVFTFAGLLGPKAARSRLLALAETPPELFWGGLLLALWPGPWGPPGRLALGLAFLAAMGPAELRWLCSVLPEESPFPAVWGEAALRRSRWLALRRLLVRWVAVRLPLWITGTLVLESLLGVPGLGLDWSARLGRGDRAGLLVWIAAFALLHLLAPDPVENP